jgi:UDP-N-acetylglucosamine acyltransferase
MSCKIHPSAIVDPAAELGDDVSVGAYSVIGPNVQIGAGVRIHPHVVVDGYTTLGDQTEVFPFASIGTAPQDLKFHGEKSTLVIGKKNKIREYVTIQPGTEHATMTTIVGDNNLFMASSHIGHDCRVGSNNVFANSVALAGHVTVMNNIIVGGLVGIHQYVRIGDFVMLSGGSMVGHDVPPYCIAQGDRCFLRGINTIGLGRAGFSEEQISDVRKTYRLLFMGSGKFETRLANLPVELRDKEHIQAMLNFIQGSERGVSTAARH